MSRNVIFLLMYHRHRLSDLTYKVHLVQEVGISEYTANIPLPNFRTYAIGTLNEALLTAESLPPTVEWLNRSQDLTFLNYFLLGHSGPLFMPTDGKKNTDKLKDKTTSECANVNATVLRNVQVSC